MPTPDALIREAIWHYPSLFPTRSHALIGILGTTNYYWHDGELHLDGDFADDEARNPHPTTHAEAIAQLERREARSGNDLQTSPLRETLIARACADADHTAHTRANVDAIAAQSTPLPNISEISPYAPMRTIPDDATDAWLDACEEAATLAIACTGAHYLVPGDIGPQLPLSTEVTDADRTIEKIWSDTLEKAPRSDEQMLADRVRNNAEWQTERLMRHRAEHRAIASNRATGAATLERVRALRAARNAGTGATDTVTS